MVLGDACQRRVPGADAGDHVGVRASVEQGCEHVGAAGKGRVNHRLPVTNPVRVIGNALLERI